MKVQRRAGQRSCRECSCRPLYGAGALCHSITHHHNGAPAWPHPALLRPQAVPGAPRREQPHTDIRASASPFCFRYPHTDLKAVSERCASCQSTLCVWSEQVASDGAASAQPRAALRPRPRKAKRSLAARSSSASLSSSMAPEADPANSTSAFPSSRSTSSSSTSPRTGGSYSTNGENSEQDLAVDLDYTPSLGPVREVLCVLVPVLLVSLLYVATGQWHGGRRTASLASAVLAAALASLARMAWLERAYKARERAFATLGDRDSRFRPISATAMNTVASAAAAGAVTVGKATGRRRLISAQQHLVVHVKVKVGELTQPSLYDDSDGPSHGRTVLGVGTVAAMTGGGFGCSGGSVPGRQEEPGDAAATAAAVAATKAAPSGPRDSVLTAVHCYHGFGANLGSYKRVQDELAVVLRGVVTAHDMPGFGLTQRPSDTSSYFLTFNGRLGRLVMDYELQQLGLIGRPTGWDNREDEPPGGPDSDAEAEPGATARGEHGASPDSSPSRSGGGGSVPSVGWTADAAVAAGGGGDADVIGGVSSTLAVPSLAGAGAAAAAVADAAAADSGGGGGAVTMTVTSLGAAVSKAAGDRPGPVTDGNPGPGGGVGDRSRAVAGQQHPESRPVAGPPPCAIKRILVGHSMGGACASLEAVTNPDGLSGLVLVAPAVVALPGPEYQGVALAPDRPAAAAAAATSPAAAAAAAEQLRTTAARAAAQLGSEPPGSHVTDPPDVRRLYPVGRVMPRGSSDGGGSAAAAGISSGGAGGGRYRGERVGALVRAVRSMAVAAASLALLGVLRLLSPIITLLLRALVRKRTFWVKGLQQAYYDPGAVTPDIVNSYRLPQLVRGWEEGMVRFLLARLVGPRLDLRELLRQAVRQLEPATTASVLASTAAAAAADARAQAAAALKPTTTTTPAAAEGQATGDDGDLASRLAALVAGRGLPVLIIHGLYDKLVPASNSQRLARMLPGCELVLLDRCGHMPQEEMPAVFVNLVAEFAARLPPPGGASMEVVEVAGDGEG